MLKVIAAIFGVGVLAVPGAPGAGDFFGVPDKAVVPKPVAATPAPGSAAPATAAPAAPLPDAELRPSDEKAPAAIVGAPTQEEAPVLFPDGPLLRTAAVGPQKAAGKPFRDLGPDQGVLIGFEYTTRAGPGSAIQSITPLYVRNAGKARGTLRGLRPPGTPGTVLEARPGFAVGAVELKVGEALEAFRVTFFRYQNDALDPNERYTAAWAGSESPTVAQRLRTDTRPILGVFGKAEAVIHELGFVVRKETGAARPTATISGNPFGTPIAPVAPPEDRPAAPSPTPLPAPTTPVSPSPSVVATPTGPQVFAGAGGDYIVFHNGRPILNGADGVQSGHFPVAKGDVLTAIVKVASGNTDDPWFSLRLVRDGKTILDAGDMQYELREPPSWKVSRMMTGFRTPKIWTHEKEMGGDSRVRAAWSTNKDAAATTLYFKGLVP